MGQKMVRFGAIRGTRPCQDESMEVREVGRIRPCTSGCNGVHFAWWGVLICGLLQHLKQALLGPPGAGARVFHRAQGLKGPHSKPVHHAPANHRLSTGHGTVYVHLDANTHSS